MHFTNISLGRLFQTDECHKQNHRFSDFGQGFSYFFNFFFCKEQVGWEYGSEHACLLQADEMSSSSAARQVVMLDELAWKPGWHSMTSQSLTDASHTVFGAARVQWSVLLRTVHRGQTSDEAEWQPCAEYWWHAWPAVWRGCTLEWWWWR